MPDHPDLKDEDIKNILAYVKAESKDVTKEKPPFARPSEACLYTTFLAEQWVCNFGLYKYSDITHYCNADGSAGKALAAVEEWELQRQ